MTSNAAKGAYYKTRTKKYLEAQGYQVAFLERVLWIQTAHGRVPVKRDQLGSDLLAVNHEHVVFVQVKGGMTGRKNVSAARKAFQTFVFPAGTEQWIVLWIPRARQPEVMIVSTGPCGSAETPLPFPRRRHRPMPLFDQQASPLGARAAR